MSALELTPEQHLATACEALDGVLPGWRGTESLSTYATAHLLAAQVKMGMGAGVPYGTYPWEKEEGS